MSINPKILGFLLLGYIVVKILIYLFVFFIAGLGMNQAISNERYDCDCTREKLIEEFLKYREKNREKVVGEIKEEVNSGSGYGYSTRYLLNESIIYIVTINSAVTTTGTNTIMLAGFYKNGNYENTIQKGTEEYFKYRKQFEREFIDKLGVKCNRREEYPPPSNNGISK